LILKNILIGRFHNGKNMFKEKIRARHISS
jgi:hypothetical protein